MIIINLKTKKNIIFNDIYFELLYLAYFLINNTYIILFEKNIASSIHNLEDNSERMMAWINLVENYNLVCFGVGWNFGFEIDNCWDFRSGTEN